MFLTLTPDDNFKDSGKQIDQVDFTSSIPSGLLLQPNTKIALYSASWKVIEGITIPTGSFSVSVMGHTFNIDIAGQTFQEPPTGSSDTAGSLCANYLNDLINDKLKEGAVTWYKGTQEGDLLEPAYKRFGDTGDASTSSNLWQWDATGKDFSFEMKYNSSNTYDTDSTVMVSGSNAALNFNDDAYEKVQAVDTDLAGTWRYRLRPRTSKNTPGWSDSGFCAFGSAFCTDGTAEGGKGKHGELVFRWHDGNGGQHGMVGFSTKDFDPFKAQTQPSIKASIDLFTGITPTFREGTALTPTTAPPVVANGMYFRIRMESNVTGDETFTYAYSTDGIAYTEIAFNDSPDDRYKSENMDSEEIMPFFKPYSPYSTVNVYGIDNMECSLVPSKDQDGGAGYKWSWSNFPTDVEFSPGDLTSIFDIKGFKENNGAGKSDGGVVSNVNTSTSGVYVDIPSLGVKSITSGVERNVIGCLPVGEMSDGTNGMGSIHGLQYCQVYNVIYHDINNQQEREHNQMRVRLIDQDGTPLTNITNPAITLCVKPAST